MAVDTSKLFARATDSFNRMTNPDGEVVDYLAKPNPNNNFLPKRKSGTDLMIRPAHSFS
jgi:hypothetical protein